MTVSPVLASHVQSYLNGLKCMSHHDSKSILNFPAAHSLVPSASNSHVNLNTISGELLEVEDTNFSESAWPLVTTFAKLLMMLDGTTSESFFENAMPMHVEESGIDNISRDILDDRYNTETDVESKKKEFVTYAYFDSVLWPKMSSSTLHSSTVWTEIQSHIKVCLLLCECEASLV